ncbi:MAG: 3-deoxy-D-manno-octulosonic acid transferase, partial [Candidatus Latescibacteria bacterium]|nr:3-deoxy-D-manno-octulosonic acid transferase [Candidatus Latescibacterota bacterium]
DPRPLTPASVILLDTIGELAGLYAVADAAFVGATLVPLGGHNLLEPAAHGVPVLFGPHTQNVRANADALRESGGGCEVKDSRELADALLRLLDRPDERRRMGQAAVEAVRSQRGNAEQTVELVIEKVLKTGFGVRGTGFGEEKK